MKKKYDLTYMRYLRHNMDWITADYTDRFDYILRRPIHNIQLVREYFKECITTLSKRLADPILSSQQSDFAYDYKFVDDLESHGESVARILDWLRSMDDHPVNDNTSAYYSWKNYFNIVMQGRFIPVENARILQFFDTYKTNVFEPYGSFNSENKKLSTRWIEKPETRTQYDQFLGKNSFDEAQISPGIYFSDLVEKIYFRRWWRQCRNFLDASEKEILFSDMVTFLQNPKVSHLGTIHWEDVISIDEAIDIDNIPDFESYARPVS